MMDSELKAQLDRIEQVALLAAKKVLNIGDVVLLTGLSQSRIRTLCNEREMPHYKQGKLYFKRDELEAWMTANKRPTNSEMRGMAQAYTLYNPIN